MNRNFDNWWERKGRSDASIISQLGVSVPMAKFLIFEGFNAGWKEAKRLKKRKGAK